MTKYVSEGKTSRTVYHRKAKPASPDGVSRTVCFLMNQRLHGICRQHANFPRVADMCISSLTRPVPHMGCLRHWQLLTQALLCVTFGKCIWSSAVTVAYRLRLHNVMLVNTRPQHAHEKSQSLSCGGGVL